MLFRSPRYRCDVRDTEGAIARTNVPELMDELFERCLDAGLVVMPASVFATPFEARVGKVLDQDDPIDDVSALFAAAVLVLYERVAENDVRVRVQRINFLRTTFAGEESIMEPALEILGRVLRDFFEEK